MTRITRASSGRGTSRRHFCTNLILENVAIPCEWAPQQKQNGGTVSMRFVIAAFLAWSALGLDVDKLNKQSGEKDGGHRAALANQITGSIAAPSDNPPVV